MILGPEPMQYSIIFLRFAFYKIHICGKCCQARVQILLSQETLKPKTSTMKGNVHPLYTPLTCNVCPCTAVHSSHLHYNVKFQLGDRHTDRVK